ncbi:hypothetical protein GCM10026982_42810 [Nocardiopsis aegyptia]
MESQFPSPGLLQARPGPALVPRWSPIEALARKNHISFATGHRYIDEGVAVKVPQRQVAFRVPAVVTHMGRLLGAESEQRPRPDRV